MALNREGEKQLTVELHSAQIQANLAPKASCLPQSGIGIHRAAQTSEGKQRFICRELPCDGRTFILDYSYPAYNRKVKQQPSGYGA